MTVDRIDVTLELVVWMARKRDAIQKIEHDIEVSHCLICFGVSPGLLSISILRESCRISENCE